MVEPELSQRFCQNAGERGIAEFLGVATETTRGDQLRHSISFASRESCGSVRIDSISTSDVALASCIRMVDHSTLG
jgi:hypothetical protein